MVGCCDRNEDKNREVAASAASARGGKSAPGQEPACCGAGDSGKKEAACCGGGRGRPDWLLWIGGGICLLALLLRFLAPPAWQVTWHPGVTAFVHGSVELLGKMWWGLVAGILFVGVLAKVPRDLVMSVLGKGGRFSGLLRATGAGVALDLCSHGILLVGMQLYRRGASLGQVVAFLVASPWNSFSLTLILIGLIGLPWTLAFIGLSMVVALISGWILDACVRRGVLPDNPNSRDLPADFRFWKSLRAHLRGLKVSRSLMRDVLVVGLRESRMILRWIFVGVVLAGLIRALLDPAQFKDLFGPTLAGLALTLLATTIIEVCSEGSSPVAADLLGRAGAPGNAFTFLMAGVATDYTEIMGLKETTRSWKIALFLPLVTVPQTLVVGYLLNAFAGG